ncbi:MAG: hypothetical protein DRI77_02445 [Chloroflexi bacterium]|nr:MAG: hypothetical protein DRI77_02445 [Chloroflexota bacterium]
MLNYPLGISFKIAALSPQISVTDASGNLVLYVKQKLFKLKEAVTVFADAQQTQPLYTMNADRVLDFSARYNFANQQGLPLGAVKRQGMKSLWKARYDILDGDAVVMTIQEEDPWVRVIDSFLNQIPIVGLFSGYMFHPAYLISRMDETVIMRVQKQPAFFEGKFTIEKKAEFSETEEKRIILSVLMMLLLERTRG